MHPREDEIERLITRLVPDAHHGWIAATPEDIAAIEANAGRPLPPFYRWFLTRMGRYMGALEYASIDFSVERVLLCYREEFEEPDPRYLLIGYQCDPVVPMHIWYDLDRPNRGDALVVTRAIGDTLVQHDFETLREMLAYKAMLNYRLPALQARCRGEFTCDGPGVRARLERAIEALKFEQPIPTGPYCGIFDRPDAAMVCHVSPDGGEDDVLFFNLGADSPGKLRRILGVITKETGLDVEIDEP
ncbi:SMI1/KNR4 family protein [Nannocystis punicea]|uniref:SMI1/KNR4 family protein n=1 Tax=Nannocystis punicea TaxID=2995304 RepID=A0ABY7HDS0_9BACT|nr:SMI1/KNR4 family protein [Nannocystis poenicansa]WAS97247.1 SMI1/KNR4 family protein [Nannocystis poenicansa]